MDKVERTHSAARQVASFQLVPSPNTMNAAQNTKIQLSKSALPNFSRSIHPRLHKDDGDGGAREGEEGEGNSARRGS